LPGRTKLPPAFEEILRGAVQSFAREVSEVLTNTVAAAADDALERVELKAEAAIEGIKRARGAAQKRSRRGRRSP
jgi:hypothetical protein